ncbi:MAG: M28 family peptidase [Bacteroidales bacterium]|nr:M28 family peptidase [Bacteroidales bacterium]
MKALLIIFVIIPLVSFSQSISFENEAVGKRICNDIAVLANDSLGGREAGSIYEKNAANYISARFVDCGLKPLSSDSSFSQGFTVNYNVQYKGKFVFGSDTAVYKKDFSIIAFSGNKSAEGKMYDADYGPKDTLGIKDDGYQGHIVLMNSGSRINKKESNDLHPYYRALEAQKAGAKAVVFYNMNSAYYRSLFSYNSSRRLTIPVAFASDKLVSKLRSKTDCLVILEAVIKMQSYEMMNVAGFLDKKAEKTVIIGAHFDHLGINSSGIIMNGADDNASGTAGIIELARILSASSDSSVNYLFIAFSGEEKGLFGSYHYSRHPLIPMEKVLFMLNFDMIGRLGVSSNKLLVLGMGSSSRWKTIIKSVPQNFTKLSFQKGAPEVSDQFPFLKYQIPVIYFTSGIHPQYHTQFDDVEYINCESTAKVVLWVSEIVMTAAKQEVPFSRPSGFSQTTATIAIMLGIL